jgi:hypothetical protein
MATSRRADIDQSLTILLSGLAVLGAILCLVGWYRWAT